MGKIVRFDLQNSKKKYTGIKNKYCYQTNIHNLIYKDANFKNVKYQASNITKCNFNNAFLQGVDFCNTNLKSSSFKNAKFKDVIFFNCNLRSCDFKGASFENVSFICTSVENSRNMALSEQCKFLRSYPKLKISNRMQENLLLLANQDKILLPHVIHVNKNKPNHWTLKLLIDYCNETDLARCFYALNNRNDKRNFYTVWAYKQFIDKYLKRE